MLTGWIVLLAALVAVFRLRDAPFPILLMLAPLFVLMSLLSLKGVLSGLSAGHWALKIKGMLRLRSAIQSALARPPWFRIASGLAYMGWVGLISAVA